MLRLSWKPRTCREREDFKFSDTVIEQGWMELPWEKLLREVYEGLAVNTKKREALRIARSVEGHNGFEAYVKLKTRVCAPDHGKGRAENAGGLIKVKRTPELEESEAKWEEAAKDLTKLDGGEGRCRRR